MCVGMHVNTVFLVFRPLTSDNVLGGMIDHLGI